MRLLPCLALFAPLTLAAQAPVAGPTYAALRHGISAPAAKFTDLKMSSSVRRAPRWVVGGVIGGVVTAGLMLEWVRAWDGSSDSRTSTREYLTIAFGSAFAGFVIGSLIAGK